MNKYLLSIIFISLISYTLQAQSSNDILVGGGFDLIKTDNNQLFDKVQIGLEAHYFVVRNFAAGAGFEIWPQQKSSFMMGMRWYALDHVFVRARGLIGANDVSIGGGWAKPINENWRFEAIGDFYVADTEFAIRAGVSYIIKKK
jgi:hypothetical protein